MSARNKKRARAAGTVSQRQPWPLAVAAFLRRRSRAIALAAVAIASLRIAATYTVFNQTFDEPLHIGCGIEWLGGVVCADETPPLARVAEAAGPFLLGVRASGAPFQDMETEYGRGAQMLYSGGRYDLTLALARLGNLPFFWVACAAVYLFGLRYFDAGVAAASVVLFSLLPPVLAHAGLATVDLALAAMLGAAFLTGLAWLERPGFARGARFGALAALAVLAKYSALVFLPAAAALSFVVYAWVERPHAGSLLRAAWQRVPSFLAAIAVAVLVIWAGYRLSYGISTLGGLRVPAPQLFSGLKMVAAHNQGGHYAYLLGRRSTSGWWYFYFVVLAVKTPLAFLALLGFGIAPTFRKNRAAAMLWLPLAFSAAILGVGLFSRINIGVRHILPVYLGFAVAAGVAAVRMLETGDAGLKSRGMLLLLIVWFAGSSLWAHPDYLAYFNELAGSHPENVLLDSDLDWGQDMKRLATKLRAVGAPFVTFTTLADADLPEVLGFPPIQQSSVPVPSPGWNAVSLTQWKSRRLRLLNTHPEVTPWPDLAPPGERIGRGIMLWYFPPETIPRR